MGACRSNPSTNTRVFTTDFLANVLDIKENYEYCTLVDTDSDCAVHEYIFEFEDKLWAIRLYHSSEASVGALEDYESLEAIEVEEVQVQKIVTEFKPVLSWS